MSTKNQSLQKRKAAKAKARAKKVQHDKHVENTRIQQVASRRESQRLTAKIAREGTMKVAAEYHAMKKRAGGKGDKLTTLEVVNGINKFIPVVGVLHGGIEVVYKLVAEGKITLTAAQTKFIEDYDRNTVKLSEDVSVILGLVEAGKQPEDYMSIFIHYIDIVAAMAEINIPDIRQFVFKDIEEMITDYVREHKLENEDNLAYGMRMHDARMKVVTPLYRTHTEALDELLDFDQLVDAEEPADAPLEPQAEAQQPA